MLIRKIATKITPALLVFALLGCSNPDFDIWRADQLSGLSQRSQQAGIRLYQRALNRLPEGSRADAIRLKLGDSYLRNGDYDSAVAQFRKIKSRQALPFLAQTLFKKGDFTDALEIFNKIGDKGSAEDLYFYGLTLEKNNLYDQAVRIYALIKVDSAFGKKAKDRLEAINLNSPKALFSGIDEATRKIIQESPGQENYPEASGLYLLSDEKIEVTDDNRMIVDSHYVIKILNDRGKEKFAEIVLNYDSTYEKVELEYARTIKPDGTVVTVGDKNIRDVSLYLNFPLYSNARARIISMPEVTAGSCIEYRAKLYQSQLPDKKNFNMTYWLQADEPILFQRSTINVPKEKNLQYKIVNPSYNTFGFDMAPKVSEEGNRQIFFSEFKNVPQIIPEPGMPSLSKVDPYILFSTFSGWQEIYAWWRDLYKDKIAADVDIKVKVRELIKEKKTPEEKIRAIYNYCAQEVRYVAVEYGDAGYEPHKASEIFKNKYGDCKDKAILLITMLREAGIEAYPVLISTQDSFDVQEDQPALLFNHAIAAVPIGDQLVFMDSTADTCSFFDLPPGDQDRTTIVFFKDHYKLVKTPLFGPDHNKAVTTMKIKVNRDESIEAQRQADTQGIYQQAQRSWLKFTMPILIEEGLKSRARAIADSAVLKNYEIKNVDDLDLPVQLKYSFSAPQYLTKAGSGRIIDRLGGFDASVAIREKRAYPIEYPALSGQEETIEIELPIHLAVKYLPAPVLITTKWFDLVSRYEMVTTHKIRYYRQSKNKERVVSIQEYPAFKKATEEAVTSVNQQVVLEETKEIGEKSGRVPKK